MRNTYKIEDLPEAVKSGKISSKEGAKYIWEDIYTHPLKYGLFHFSEDQKSDFLLDSHELFEKIFDKFIPGITSFRTYISGCLAAYKKTFLKRQLARENELRTLDSFLQTKKEEDEQKYLVSFKTNKDECEKKENLRRTFSDIISQRKNTSLKKTHRTAELTTLILMLKACTDVDDETISAVSDFTRIDESLLHEEVQNLKETMSRRTENHQKLIQRRNNAFFFHRKYMQEMISQDSNKEKRETLQKKYNGQTRRWKENNKTLAVHANSPSNNDIAKVIGIKPRMVSFYINHAKNEENISKIKELYKQSKETEDLFVESNLMVNATDEYNRLEGADFV